MSSKAKKRLNKALREGTFRPTNVAKAHSRAGRRGVYEGMFDAGLEAAAILGIAALAQRVGRSSR